jgi:hypothetical protein
MIVQTQLYYRNFSKDWIVQRISVRVEVNFNRYDFLMLYSAPGSVSRVRTAPSYKRREVQ